MNGAPNMEIKFPYLHEETDRYGNVRIYVRRMRRRIRIRGVPGSPAFMTAYHAAVADLAPMARAREDAPDAISGTFGGLAADYFNSAEFKGLDRKSQATRRQIITRCLLEPLNHQDDQTPMAEVPISVFGLKHVRVLRDRKAETPGAANNRLKYLSAMFGWALEAHYDGVTGNPVRDVKSIDYATEGFHTWSREEVAQYMQRHPIGTKAHLALGLLLFTGARRGDVVTFGRQHVKDGWLRYVPRKTRHKRARLSEKPILPVLAEIIKASPTGDMTFLVTARGLAFTANGFGGWFRDRCDEAGLPQCSAHGLKKAGAVIAAENGATVPQLQALFDWDTIGQAQTYIEKANRRTMARDAMPLINLSHSAAYPSESATGVAGAKKTDT